MVELLQSLTSNNHKSNTLTPATWFRSFTHYSIVMVFKHLHIALWFLIITLFFTLLICFKKNPIGLKRYKLQQKDDKRNVWYNCIYNVKSIWSLYVSFPLLILQLKEKWDSWFRQLHILHFLWSLDVFVYLPVSINSWWSLFLNFV